MVHECNNVTEETVSYNFISSLLWFEIDFAY